MIFLSHLPVSLSYGCLISIGRHSQQLIAVVAAAVVLSFDGDEVEQQYEEKKVKLVQTDHNIIKKLTYEMTQAVSQKTKQSVSLDNKRQTKNRVVIPANYIKQYFQKKEVTVVPEICISLFYEKLHILTSLFMEQIVNVKQYLVGKYKIGLLLNDFGDIGEDGRQVTLNIKKIDMNKFVCQLKPTKYGVRLYFGEMKQNIREGYGLDVKFMGEKVVYLYQGYFNNNVKLGVGFQLRQGLIYIGNMLNNLPFSQKSIILYPNGDVYLGQVKNGKKEGAGTYFQSRNKNNPFYKYQTSRKPLDYQEIILAQWMSDNIVSKQPTSDKIPSLNQIFSQNMLNSNNNWLIMHNSVYHGDMKQLQVTMGDICHIHFIRDGKGFQYFNNGDIYQGEYVRDKPHGFGKYIWGSGDQYHGEFFSGVREGKGRWVGVNQQIYQGQHKNDERCGMGIYKWPNGQIYEGQFKKDLRDGYGKMIWENGEIYTGQWKEGLQHGQGQVRVDLKYASLHKRFIFDRGCKIRSSLEISQEEFKRNRMMKTGQTPESRKFFDKIQQSVEKTKNKVRSLAELKPIKKKILQEKRTKSLFNSQTMNNTKKNAINKKINQSPKSINSLNIDSIRKQNNKFPKITPQKKRYTQEEEELQTSGLKPKYVSKTTEIHIKKRQHRNVLKLKQMKVSKYQKPLVELGDTLLRPIKWQNFKDNLLNNI